MLSEMDLKEARLERHLSQRQLAESAGLNQPHLSKIEKGEYSPRQSTRKRIERVLGIKVDWIMTQYGVNVQRLTPELEKQMILLEQNFVEKAMLQYLFSGTGSKRMKIKHLKALIKKYKGVQRRDVEALIKFKES